MRCCPNPNFYPNDALSVVLINTDVGLDLWRKCNDLCDSVEIDPLNEAKANTQLRKPSQCDMEKRSEIYKMLETDPMKLFETVLKPKNRIRYQIRIFLENHVPFHIRRKLGLK